jgi:hypothetical protein
MRRAVSIRSTLDLRKAVQLERVVNSPPALTGGRKINLALAPLQPRIHGRTTDGRGINNPVLNM